MQKSELRVGMEVMIGRPNGERTRSRVTKLNLKTAKCVTLEQRAGRAAGMKIRVSYDLMYPVDGATSVSDFPGEVISLPSPTAKWSIDDRVAFDNRGRTITGTVSKINRKTVRVDPDNPTRKGQYWNVSPSLLRTSDTTAPVVPPEVKAAEDLDEAKKRWERFARSYGLEAAWFGQTFTHKRSQYKIVGLNLRSPKYPIEVRRTRDDRGFKFTVALVQRVLAA
jgi:hypothetical protein